MKITTSKPFERFIKSQMMIINIFLFASLLITSLIIGFVPQIPVWVLLITIPVCLASWVLFYIKAYSYIHEHWAFCREHNAGYEFSKKKNLKYIYLGIFILIPGFNWITMVAIAKHEGKQLTEEKVVCGGRHLKTRSDSNKEELETKNTKRIEEEF